MNSRDLVYICSPLRAETDMKMKCNMQSAKEYMQIVSKRLGCRAVAPHAILPEILDDNIPEERAIGVNFGIELLRICKALVICGDIISSGMKKEIEFAEKLGLPIFKLSKEPIKTKARITIEIVGEYGDMYL